MNQRSNRRSPDSRDSAAIRSRPHREQQTESASTKAESIYQVLRDEIVSGALAPGARLDQEWLAGRLDVSRMPLRQALGRLEAEGLIENRPYKGAVVSPLSLAEMEDIYAARRELEGMLAEIGTRRASAATLNQLESFVDEQAEALRHGDMGRFVQLDRSFHLTLYAASNYRQATSIVERLCAQSERYVRIYATTNRGAEASLAEHREILARCRAQDAETCRQLIEAHVQRGFTVLARVISNHHLQLEAGDDR